MNISVVGIGKLGLCFSLTLEKAGYDVIGVDVNENYVAQVNNKTLHSPEEGVSKALKRSNNFKATTSLKEGVIHSDLVFVVVATPSLSNGRYDHSQIDSLIDALTEMGPSQEQKHLIVCCTVMPGYCDSIKEKLNKLNYTVSYNPEFIAQGTILRDQSRPDMILIGEGNSDIGDTLEKIYNQHTVNEPRFCRMSPLEAEITKISLNCFLTTKIAYANMVGDIVRQAGGDPHKVLNAIGQDSRIGNKYLGYGYGYGGPCFPRDNRALSIFASDTGLEALISDASDKSNMKHLQNQIDHYVKHNTPEQEIVFDYVTYKPESTLLVESQQLAYAAGLAREGYKVRIKERSEVIHALEQDYGDLFIYEERKND